MDDEKNVDFFEGEEREFAIKIIFGKWKFNNNFLFQIQIKDTSQNYFWITHYYLLFYLGKKLN